MQIGFFPRYSRLGASSRYRFYMFFDELVKAGFSGVVSIRNGFSDEYLKKLYRHGKAGRFRQLKEFLHMYCRAYALPEKLIIEYELVPQLSYEHEKRLIGNREYILNFDDNVWEKYRNNPALCDKYDRLCSNAAGIIVANDFLYEKVRRLNDNVVLIPTVLDLEKYSVKQFKKFDVFTVVWIGTPVTYKYLEQNLDALRMMTAENNCELLVTADENLAVTRPLSGVNARYVSWSEASENELLARSHAGIMPLTDDEFSRGKSAFKLLQYQASSLPLLASPVGENNKVVLPGKNGFLCSKTEDWSKAVQLLRTDQSLYEQYSSNAQSMAYEYSLQKYFPIFCEFVERTFKIKF